MRSLFRAWWLTLFAACVTAAASQAVEVELDVAGVNAGLGFYEPRHWGVVRSVVENRSASEAAPLVVVSFDRQATFQFGRRAWVPASSKRTVYNPVLAPKAPRQDQSYSIHTRLIDDSGARERAAPAQPNILIKREASYNSAALSGADNPWSAKALTALREGRGLKPTNVFFRDESAPDLPAAWGALDGLLIASSSVDFNADQLSAIRQWVLGGGRLWIMLDAVEPSFPARLLGDAWPVTVLDRLELTDFSLTHGDGSTRAVCDYPVPMVRVVASNMTVTHRVSGMPAALRQKIGHGELLVTTVGARAWLDRDGGPTQALRELGWFVSSAGRVSPTTASDRSTVFGEIARQEIGYEIISRGPVMAALIVFTLLLLGAGVLLARSGRLEWLGPFGAAVAVVVAAVLAGAGLVKQSATPGTLAAVQLVEAAPDLPLMKVHGLASVYVPPDVNANRLQVRGDQGGVAQPDLSTQGGKLLRLIWTDPAHWSFQDLALASGAVRSVRYEHGVVTGERPRVSVRFTPEGVVGTYAPGAAGPLEDAVIAGGGRGVLLPQFDDPDGLAFIADADDEPGRGQYIRSNLLSGTQVMRQQAYRALLGSPAFPAQPSLIGWAESIAPGVTVSGVEADHRVSLVVTPLEIQTPRPGERITVPSTFMPMKRASVGKGTTNTIYNPDTGEWIANVSTPQTLLSAFGLPAELRHLALESARFSIDIDAPGWKCEVITQRRGRIVTLAERDNPLGPIDFELIGDAVPTQTDQGVLMGLRITPLEGGVDSRKWTLHDMRLSVAGVATDAGSRPTGPSNQERDSHE